MQTATSPADGPPSFDLKACFARLTDAASADTQNFPTSAPLDLDNVLLLRDRVRKYEFSGDDAPIDAYLGLDIGSVGTKLVVIDEDGAVVHEIFTRTEGRPIEVVSRCLRELEEAVGWRVRICAVGSTGSGRELIGELVGADAVTDEITCHKTGATFVGDRLLGRRPDTIFEIGGQDSKFISLAPEGGDSTDTVVVDFTMNEACAAGTGSFLEERADELDIAIKGEFAELALSSTRPSGWASDARCSWNATSTATCSAAPARPRPGRRAGLLGGLQLHQPRRARPEDRRLRLLPGRHGLQRRRGRRFQQGLRQADHRPAAQRRDGRDRRRLLARDKMSRRTRTGPSQSRRIRNRNAKSSHPASAASTWPR